jgi:hypothetical protein
MEEKKQPPEVIITSHEQFGSVNKSDVFYTLFCFTLSTIEVGLFLLLIYKSF